jgi:S1-C subfamily serine protease
MKTRLEPARLFVAIVAMTIASLLSGCRTFVIVPQAESVPPPPPQPKPSEISEIPLPPLRLEALIEDEKNTVTLYRELNRGVVNVTSVGMTYSWLSQVYPTGGAGSGSIIDSDGLVLTNYHVIQNANHVTITMYDGVAYPAKIVGKDPENDIALVRFNPAGRKLTVIEMGSSDDLQVGQKVLALGNPFGLERTLTTGVISGLERPLQTEQGFIISELIQTDASINPGNSGGPLIDSSGKMIGVSTMILSPSGGSVGIGFAVPVEVAIRIIPDLIEYGRVIRGWIDIELIPINAALARQANLAVDAGVLVTRVLPDSPADRAGIIGGSQRGAAVYGGVRIPLGGDIIVSINNELIASYSDYFGALEATVPGERIALGLVRGDAPVELDVVLVERPDSLGW